MNFSHKVRAETVRLLDFPRAAEQTQLHKSGCAHQSKADRVSEEMDAAELVEQTLTVYRDDYYYVAPCARKEEP